MKYVAEELREQVSDIYGTPHVLNADPSSTNTKTDIKTNTKRSYKRNIFEKLRGTSQ